MSIVHWDKLRSELLVAPGNPDTAITTSLEKATKRFSDPAIIPSPDLVLCKFLAGGKRAQRTFLRTRTPADDWILKKANMKVRQHSKRLQKKEMTRFLYICYSFYKS